MHCPKIPVAMPETDPVADTFTTAGIPSFCDFGQSLILLNIKAANEPQNIPSAGGLPSSTGNAPPSRDPLVSEEDLHLIQTHLLRHLTYCRDCAIEGICIATRPSAPAADTPPT